MDNFGKILGGRIRDFREQLGISQEFLANNLGLNRSSVSQIEKGKRKVSAEEIVGLANLFLISSDLLLGFETEVEVVLEKERVEEKNKQETRISVPQKKVEKFKEVLIYILEKAGSKPNVGETVLYKLLYFIDFDYYEKYEEQLIGATYIKNKHGPTPNEFKRIIAEMSNEIEKVEGKYFTYPQTKYLPKRKVDLSKLKAQEVELIDNVLARLADMSAKEISDYSHGDVPWQVSEPGEIIDYESVFYRTAPYSVRTYDED